MAHYVQYIVANAGLGMSPGKLAAQVAHASVKGFQLTVGELGPEASRVIKEWDKSGHTKIVLEARDTEHLSLFREFAKSRGINSWIVIDEGRTEVPVHSATALGFPILDKKDPEVAHTFADLKTYKGPKLRRQTWREAFGNEGLDFLRRRMV